MITGAYYPDNLNGFSYIFKKNAFSINFGYTENGIVKGSYCDILPTMKAHLNSPDGKINVLSWKTSSAEITMTWVNSNNFIWGKISVSGTAEIVYRSYPAWKQLETVDYFAHNNRISAEYDENKFYFTVNSLCTSIKDGKNAALHCKITDSSSEFVAGINNDITDFTYSKNEAKKFIDEYEDKRCSASGVLGDFISPIMREANISQIYHPVQNFIGYSVVRAWCIPDQVRYFCWDNFFTGLLLSIEDKDAAERAADTMFFCTGSDGHIPNVGTEIGCVSKWSQPPVCSMAVYKMYQRLNNFDYLEKVYEKLCAAHRWWFTINPETNLPNRDSNGNGLLQWGGGSHQDAKFESGMDDSPMYDEFEIDRLTGCMKLDDVGLTSMWTMDSYYLSLIADVLDNKGDAECFRQEFGEMKRKINDLMWNEELGIYCNRYHSPQIESFDITGVVIPIENLLTDEFAPGLNVQFFIGNQFESPALTCIMPNLNIDLEKLPIECHENDNLSAIYTGYIKPSDDGYYALQLDYGLSCAFRFFINDELLIDEKQLGIKTVYRIPSRLLKATEKYKVRIELCKNIRVSNSVQLKWFKLKDEKASVFSQRLSPTNFYPLMIGVADKEKFERMMVIYKTRFNSPYVIPTTTVDDPAYIDQQYWRGKVWAPTNYLFWLGLKKYADEKTLKEFAYNSLELFMKNYTRTGGCYENYYSHGEGSSESHYIWGALLCLIALEYFCDINDNNKVIRRSCDEGNIELKNINIGGTKFSGI
jgi:hypothetical protein